MMGTWTTGWAAWRGGHLEHGLIVERAGGEISLVTGGLGERRSSKMGWMSGGWLKGGQLRYGDPAVFASQGYWRKLSRVVRQGWCANQLIILFRVLRRCHSLCAVLLSSLICPLPWDWECRERCVLVLLLVRTSTYVMCVCAEIFMLFFVCVWKCSVNFLLTVYFVHILINIIQTIKQSSPSLVIYEEGDIDCSLLRLTI